MFWLAGPGEWGPASVGAILLMPILDVTVGANFVVIPHNKSSATIPIFVTPNWNTTIFDSTADRTPDTAKIYFGASAQGAAPQVTWRVAE